MYIAFFKAHLSVKAIESVAVEGWEDESVTREGGGSFAVQRGEGWF